MGVSLLAGLSLEAIELDIDFVANAEEDVVIPIGSPASVFIDGKLYVDVDPGAAFSAWATYSIYREAAMHSADCFYRTASKLVYTELEVATAIGSPNITPDDQTDFSPNDLSLILGSPEESVRLMTIADTMIAEDNLANVHPIGTGLVRVSEFSTFYLNKDTEEDLHFRVSFAVAQTVSLKLELIVGT